MSTTQSRGAKSLHGMHAPPPIVVRGKVGRRHRIARQRRARRARPTVRPRLQLRDHTQRLGRSCTTRHCHIVDEAYACVRGDQISANRLLDQRASCLVEVVEHAGRTVPQLRVDGIERVPVPARVSVPRYRQGGALARLRRACMHAGGWTYRRWNRSTSENWSSTRAIYTMSALARASIALKRTWPRRGSAT